MQFPADFTAREQALLGPRFDALYTYATPQPARGVTVNGLRCTPDWFAAHADFVAAPSPFCPTAFTTAPDFKPGRHPWHHAGVFYAQEPSASAPAALLDVHPGMKVADLCAAPGGKTSQLAAALQGQGLLLANEFVAARAEILRQNLERMGVTNAVITNEDTANLAKALPGVFDRVLVDAPCSGEGMFRKEPVAATQHNNALVDHCAALAKKALLRPLDEPNADPYYAALEKELLDAINATGFGPQGFGGATTCLGVAIEQKPTHVACLPVAVNISCHVTRRASRAL